MRRRKRSAAITLALSGTLMGCSEPVPQRDVYRSQAECQRDWPKKGQCVATGDLRYSPNFYFGPSHFGERDRNGLARPSRNALDAVDAGPHSTHTQVVQRGGFGDSAHLYSGGG